MLLGFVIVSGAQLVFWSCRNYKRIRVARRKNIMKKNLKACGGKITFASFMDCFDEIQEGKVQNEIYL
jgi:hypothetical protein